MSENKQSEHMDKGPQCYENWRGMNSGSPLERAFEYPLFTDARIFGNDIADDLGPYLLLNACADPAVSPQRPALFLYTEQHFKYDTTVKLKTDDAAYHGGYLQDEIAALVSLSLGIRLKAGDATRMFGPDDKIGRPVSFGLVEDPIPPPVRNRYVLPSAIGDHDLNDAVLLRSFLRLNAQDATALVRAARLYQQAVWIVESTPELSWIMLTSSVETVASRWRTTIESPVDKLTRSRPQVVELLRASGGDELVHKVAEQLAPYIGATATFVDFLVNFLPDPPAERSYDWAQHPWDQRAMKKSLGLIYRYRSKALHGGVPFPAPMSTEPRSVAEKTALVEVPIGLAMSSRGGTWASKDTPMLLHLFEYIVRKALIKWWRSLVDNTPYDG